MFLILTKKKFFIFKWDKKKFIKKNDYGKKESFIQNYNNIFNQFCNYNDVNDDRFYLFYDVLNWDHKKK